MNGLKWTRKTTAKIAAELKSVGIEVSDRTVAKLLKKLDFSLGATGRPRPFAEPSPPTRPGFGERVGLGRDRAARAARGGATRSTVCSGPPATWRVA